MASAGETIRRGLAQRAALGARLAGARRARGMSQAAVAAAVGVTVSYISNMETGRDVPNVAMLRKLAGVLGVSYTELAVVAGYADPPGGEEGAEDLAADLRWFAGLPGEMRRWLRRVAETYPG